MLPAVDLAAVRTAIEICNSYEMKREICELRSDFYINMKRNHMFNRYENYRKYRWNQIVENKASELLENLGLIKELREKVAGLVLLIGTRMLTWTVYQEITLGLSRKFSSKFLNSSSFTAQGIIDNRKTAEELMKENSLSIKQKYKLACLHCLTDHIPDLYGQMSQEDKEEFYDDQGLQRINQPQMVKFWSYHMMGKIDEVRGEKTLDEYMLESAVKSGSKAAVEYCLEETGLRRKKDAVMDAALEAVSNITFKRILGDLDFFESSDQYSSYQEGCRIPSDYFVDILYVLLSKMREDQIIEFLKKDIEGADKQMYLRYKAEEEGWKVLYNPERSRVLHYLLDWSYQSHFMKTVELMWEFLPERSYHDLLVNICDKLDPRVILKYGEEKTYDYRKLFREFWCQSPQHYKRYVCSLKESKELLVKLFRLKNFADEHWKNIELILESATDKEKEVIFSSEEGKGICIHLMKEEKWERLDGFVSNCLPSKEQAEEFKRGFSFTRDSQRVCINFIESGKWDSAELFIRWSSLNQEEVKRLKREMICSEQGRHTFCGFLLFKDLEGANKFCR